MKEMAALSLYDRWDSTAKSTAISVGSEEYDVDFEEEEGYTSSACGAPNCKKPADACCSCVTSTTQRASSRCWSWVCSSHELLMMSCAKCGSAFCAPCASHFVQGRCAGCQSAHKATPATTAAAASTSCTSRDRAPASAAGTYKASTAAYSGRERIAANEEWDSTPCDRTSSKWEQSQARATTSIAATHHYEPAATATTSGYDAYGYSARSAAQPVVSKGGHDYEYDLEVEHEEDVEVSYGDNVQAAQHAYARDAYQQPKAGTTGAAGYGKASTVYGRGGSAYDDKFSTGYGRPTNSAYPKASTGYDTMSTVHDKITRGAYDAHEQDAVAGSRYATRDYTVATSATTDKAASSWRDWQSKTELAAATSSRRSAGTGELAWDEQDYGEEHQPAAASTRTAWLQKQQVQREVLGQEQRRAERARREEAVRGAERALDGARHAYELKRAGVEAAFTQHLEASLKEWCRLFIAERKMSGASWPGYLYGRDGQCYDAATSDALRAFIAMYTSDDVTVTDPTVLLTSHPRGWVSTEAAADLAHTYERLAGCQVCWGYYQPGGYDVFTQGEYYSYEQVKAAISQLSAWELREMDDEFARGRAPREGEVRRARAELAALEEAAAGGESDDLSSSSRSLNRQLSPEIPRARTGRQACYTSEAAAAKAVAAYSAGGYTPAPSDYEPAAYSSMAYASKGYSGSAYAATSSRAY